MGKEIKKQYPQRKWTEVSHVISFSAHHKNYNGDFVLKRETLYCYLGNLEAVLKRAAKLKEPGTNIFVYQVVNIGKVALKIDWESKED